MGVKVCPFSMQLRAAHKYHDYNRKLDENGEIIISDAVVTSYVVNCPCLKELCVAWDPNYNPSGCRRL